MQRSGFAYLNIIFKAGALISTIRSQETTDSVDRIRLLQMNKASSDFLDRIRHTHFYKPDCIEINQIVFNDKHQPFKIFQLMKLKHFNLFMVLIVPSIMFSQNDSISKSQSKITQFPEKKTIMLELNFNPFSPSGVISFENLQTKYWIDNKTVLRLGLQMNNKGTAITEDDFDSAEKHKATWSENSFLLGIKPGIEFRFLQNCKISPYVGFELQYRNKSTSADYQEYVQYYDYSSGQSVIKYDFVETKIDGGIRNITSGSYSSSNGTYTYTSISYTGERAFSSIGGNMLIGSDFYFIKNMYFGFEVGLGYESIKYKQVIVDISKNVNKIITPSYNTNNLGFYYNSAIRLGVWF